MRTVTFSSTPEVDAALAELTEDGRDPSSAIREAILLLACHRRGERLYAEAAVLAADEHDLAVIREIHQDMASLRTW